MNVYLAVILALLAAHVKCNLDLSSIHSKLWTNIENQITELKSKQDQQKLKYNALKRFIRFEGFNVTNIHELSDEDDETDPFGYAALNTIKNDFWMLKSFHEQKLKTSLECDLNSLETQLSDIRQNQISTKDLESLKQSILQNFTATSHSANCVSQHPFTDTRTTQPIIINNRLEKCTPNNIVYKFFPICGTEFKFKVRAQNDVHVALAPIALAANPMYEVIIGGWSNTRSVIRKDFANDVIGVQNQGILNECEYISFWIRWDDNVIKAGYEGSSTPFISYNADDLHKVNFIGIHTGYGSIGSWIFEGKN